MWEEIAYPFPNINGATGEVISGMDKQFHPTFYWAQDRLFIH